MFVEVSIISRFFSAVGQRVEEVVYFGKETSILFTRYAISDKAMNAYPFECGFACMS